MIKTVFLCDGCSRELTEDEIYHQLYLHESPTKEIYISNNFFIFCEACALKVDNSVLKLKEELLSSIAANSSVKKKARVRKRYTTHRSTNTNPNSCS